MLIFFLVAFTVLLRFLTLVELTMWSVFFKVYYVLISIYLLCIYKVYICINQYCTLNIICMSVNIAFSFFYRTNEWYSVRDEFIVWCNPNITKLWPDNDSTTSSSLDNKLNLIILHTHSMGSMKLEINLSNGFWRIIKAYTRLFKSKDFNSFKREFLMKLYISYWLFLWLF